MANLGTDQLLTLVQLALNEIDDRPIDVTARRAARIASLLGDSVFAVYLGLELKPSGGHPPANAEDTKRLMDDPSRWDDPDGAAEQAMSTYLAARQLESGPDAGKIASHGLGEIETLISAIESDPTAIRDTNAWQLRNTFIVFRERVRHRIFAALCAWERQLTYANVNERIFERFRSKVDALLAAGAPDVLDQFSAVYRRLREATRDPDKPVAEDLAQAVTTCRRILKAVADHVLPGVKGAMSSSGNALDEAAYQNRVFEFIKSTVASDTAAERTKAAIGGLYNRFASLNKLASKGVHAELGVAEAELCAIHTYLAAGELLNLAATATSTVESPSRDGAAEV